MEGSYLAIGAMPDGKAYVMAGQASRALHTMSVLQAYQANLLKDLSEGACQDAPVTSPDCNKSRLACSTCSS